MDTFVDQPHRVSLEEIAREVGVSKATVCRALLGRSRVSEATRAKVKEVAERLGYRPDPALSALTKHRWALHDAARGVFQIALIRVLGEDPARRDRNRLRSAEAAEGVRARATELGLLLSEWVLEEQHSPAHLGRMLYNRGVDGIVISIDGPVSRWDFAWHQFAVVTLGHDLDTHPAHSVVPDWFRAVDLAVAKAREAGKRRIGFASFNRRNPQIDSLLDGAFHRHRRLLEAEFGPQPEIFEYPLSNTDVPVWFQTERTRFGDWFKSQQPDVVIDSNRMGYAWLRQAGVSIPAEVGYITTLGQDPNQPAPLSAVALHREEQGRRAVELLFNLLQLNQRGFPQIPVRLTVACGWTPGETL